MLRRQIIIGVLLSLVIASPTWAGEWEEGVRLFEEGQKLFAISRFREAKEKYERALEVFKKIGNQQLIGYAFGSLGNVYMSVGNYRKAIEYYERGLAITRKAGDNEYEGTWLGNLGIVYWNLGDYRKAIEYHKQSLAIDKKIGDKQGESASFGNLGIVYHSLGNYPKAIEYHERALTIAMEEGNKQGECNSLSNLGEAYRNLGDYLKAIEYYIRAMTIAKIIGNRQSESRNLGNMGIVFSSLGNYPKAIEYHERALVIDKRVGDKKGEGNKLGSLGNTYADLGNYSKAIEYYELALAIAKNIGNKQGEDSLLNNLGGIYLQLGDFSKAMEYYEKALAIAKNIGDKQGESNVQNNLGIAYFELGDFHKAIEYYSKALAIYKKTGIPLDIPEGNLGDTYLALGRNEEALKIYQKQDHSIRLGWYYLKQKDFKKAKQQFVRKLDKDIERRAATFIVSGQIGLGLSCEGLKEYRQARDHYQKAVEFMEHQRESLPEVARTHFLAGKVFNFPRIEAYEGLVRVSEKLDQKNEVFFWAENTRARLLSEQIAGKHKAGSFQIPSDLAEKERELINKIASNYKQQEIAFQKENKEVLKRLELEIKPLKQEQKELIDSLHRDYPQYAAIRYPQPIRAEHIPLKNNEVIIEYEVTEPYTLCMVVKDGKVEKTMIIPKTRQELENIISKFREPFKPGYDHGEFSPQLSHELYNMLLKDVLVDIPKESHLIIIPDEFTSLVPFGALALNSGEGNKPTSKLKYVSDYWSISYYQSATVLSLNRKLLRKHTPSKQLFALGDAIYSKEDNRSETVLAMRGVGGISVSSLELAHEIGEKELGYDFPRLKNTRLEVETVGKLFPFHTLFLGQDANEGKVKSLPLNQFRYILFSTHGILGNDIPYIKEPALVLNLVGNDKEDGFLTMSEIFNIKLDADLVTLSACQTGLGTQVAGEGLMGLSRAFMYAGTDTVIATLWSVTDESTSKFMVKFFEGVKSEKDKLTALKEAKLYLRNNGYDHPFYWAPFTLIGEY